MAMSSCVTKSLPFLVAPSEATPASALRLTSMHYYINGHCKRPITACLIQTGGVDGFLNITAGS
jgi:hypothetical protein